eukprot:1162090-Pelagomonas_calceolata.AAC.9
MSGLQSINLPLMFLCLSAAPHRRCGGAAYIIAVMEHPPCACPAAMPRAASAPRGAADPSAPAGATMGRGMG